MVAMAALLQASTALSATRGPAVPLKSLLQCRTVSSFSGTSLPKFSWPTKPGTKRHSSGGVTRAAAKPTKVVVEKSCHVGENFLDHVSNHIFHQIQKPFAQYIPENWDPLDFLPVNIQSNLQKSEALATLVVREILVFGMVYLIYRKIDVFFRLLYRVFTRKQRKGKPIDNVSYEESPFEAARLPICSLLILWASTRLLWVTSVLWKMQAVITPAIIYKIRAVSVVCTITWFLFRWKRLYVEDLIRQKPADGGKRAIIHYKCEPFDQPKNSVLDILDPIVELRNITFIQASGLLKSRIFAIDKIVSLAMYGLTASCIAEVLGLALGSLLAVGGVSGLAVGLAAKEVVGNMFGGASLFLTRPFVIGEKIKAGDVSGHVQDIGFMQTHVQGFDGVPVLVPNQAFTSQVITNFSRAKFKVLDASFQLNNRHIFLVSEITLKVQKYLFTHPGVEIEKSTPVCYLKSMEKDGPELALHCLIKSMGGAHFYRIQQEILIHVAKIITDTLGLDSPFTPLAVQDLDVESVDRGSLIL